MLGFLALHPNLARFLLAICDKFSGLAARLEQLVARHKLPALAIVACGLALLSVDGQAGCIAVGAAALFSYLAGRYS